MSPEPAGRVAVGRVIRVHGVEGELLVRATGDDPERFAPGAVCYEERTGRELRVVASRPLAGLWRIRFAGVESREAAEEFRGAGLFQDREDLPDPPPGSLYHYQLVGLALLDAAGRRLGDVVRVHTLPAGDVYEVEGETRLWMIPARAEFIEEIDLEAGEIRLCDRDDLIEAVEQRRASKEAARNRQRKKKRSRKRRPA